MFSALITTRASEQGARPFLRYQDSVVSWAEAADTVARLASLLKERGVMAGDRVLLAANTSPTFVYGWFALRWIGATCVPAHTGATDDFLAAIVDNASITHAVGEAGLLSRVPPALASTFIALEEVDGRLPQLAHHPASQPVQQSDLDECSILYTSGTTGAPKGVVLSEASFIEGGRHLATVLEVTQDDTIMLALPLFHTNPQVYGVMVALDTGCSLALLPEFKPAQFMDEVVRHGATGFTYVGTLLNLVLAKTKSFPPTRLRFCVGGGASERVWSEFEQATGARIHELYGMTETGGWVTATGVDERKVGWCGKVRPDMEAVILNERDEVLPPHHVGQIAVRPSRPGVIFDGYHRDPLTTLSKRSNLWFHTGDLGQFDDDGFLSFRGRADDRIRRGGENVEPSAVQDVIESHPTVAEAAVLGVPDDVMGQEIKVVLVPKPGVWLDLDLLEEFWTARLPRLALPRYVEVRDRLPKTPTQKVVTRALGDVDGDVLDLRRGSEREGRDE